jgi:two-component system, OmpR family, phosphate regulon sensor histidine kinase PhoR
MLYEKPGTEGHEPARNRAAASLTDAPDGGATASEAETCRGEAGRIAETCHELRLPIANIRLLVDTLLDGALDDHVAAERMLKRAQQEVERLQLLVNDLLTVEKASPTYGKLACSAINLEERARYASDSLKAMARAKNVQISLAIEPGWLIFANPEQFDQVLLNLLENAVKFTPEGGRVTVRSGTEAGSFAVTDTGIGMKAEHVPKIFRRFYRIDPGHCRGSTGLGLSIVKNICDLHGATISVSSREHEGSTFLLHFPPAGAGHEHI